MNSKLTKQLLLILCISITALHATAQKTYVWCPIDREVVTHTGLPKDLKVTLTVNDKTTESRRTREKCSMTEVASDLVEVVKQTFPGTSLPSVQDMPGKDNINIQIDITAYEATYSVAIWHAAVEYTVTITDGRKSPAVVKTLHIARSRRFENALGFTTAKHNLSKTYREANDEATDFIYNTLSNM